MNIKQKLTWAFAAIASLPILLVASVVIFSLRSQAQADFVEGSGREIRQIENAMLTFFTGIGQNVDYLSTLPELVAAPTLKDYRSADAARLPPPESNRQLLAIFDRFARAHPGTAYLSYGAADGGYVSWPDDADLHSYDPRVRPWYKAALAAPGQTVRTGAYYWAVDDTVLIATVRTVNDAQGKPAGVLGLDVSLKQLTDLVRQIRLGDTGYLMLVENNGNVLVDPRNAEHNFKSLGEQGRGFAVVADEVRALAKRTADSTGEIDALLGGLARRTQEVTRQMQGSLEVSQSSVARIRQASESFEQIRGSVDHIRDQNTQIAAAAEQQHQVAEEINRHIAQIQSDALLVERLAQSSHEDSQQLSALSGELQGLVGRFRA